MSKSSRTVPRPERPEIGFTAMDEEATGAADFKALMCLQPPGGGRKTWLLQLQLSGFIVVV